jgi:hypothetical protein
MSDHKDKKPEEAHKDEKHKDEKHKDKDKHKEKDGSKEKGRSKWKTAALIGLGGIGALVGAAVVGVPAIIVGAAIIGGGAVLYSKKAGADQQAKSEIKLHVVLYSAKNLQSADGSCDAFVTMKAGLAKFKSTVQSKTNNPEWNQQFDCGIILGKNDHITIVVEDQGKVTSAVIGVTALDIKPLVVGSPALQYELPLASPHGHGHSHKDSKDKDKDKEKDKEKEKEKSKDAGSIKIAVWLTKEPATPATEHKDKDKEKDKDKDKK